MSFIVSCNSLYFNVCFVWYTYHCLGFYRVPFAWNTFLHPSPRFQFVCASKSEVTLFKAAYMQATFFLNPCSHTLSFGWSI